MFTRVFDKHTELAGVDPELLLGGGANPWGGRLPNILIIFSEKPYEIKEILVRREGGRAPGVPSQINQWLA